MAALTFRGGEWCEIARIEPSFEGKRLSQIADMALGEKLTEPQKYIALKALAVAWLTVCGRYESGEGDTAKESDKEGEINAA